MSLLSRVDNSNVIATFGRCPRPTSGDASRPIYMSGRQILSRIHMSRSPTVGPSDALALSSIRRSLILMEDTIIFALVERSQFALNDSVYLPGEIPIYGKDGRQLSLLEYLLLEIEHVHGKIRRYTNPDENAFFPEYLPPLILPPLQCDQVLWKPAASVNLNDRIMEMYKKHLLPGIAMPGDDGNYGSSAVCDVQILQALSRRIHYGKFVAESKFRGQREEYTRLIENQDADAILDLLTDRAVELKVIERVKLKASTFGQDLNSDGKNLRLDPDAVGELYDEWVMPLTKDVEVEYLLKRLDEDDTSR
jgi:chorismate mutase